MRDTQHAYKCIYTRKTNGNQETKVETATEEKAGYKLVESLQISCQ